MDIRIGTRVLSNAQPMFNTLGIEVTTGHFEVRSAGSVCVNMEGVLAWWEPLKVSVHQDSARHSIKFHDAVILFFNPFDHSLYLGLPASKHVPTTKAEHKRSALAELNT